MCHHITLSSLSTHFVLLDMQLTNKFVNCLFKQEPVAAQLSASFVSSRFKSEFSFAVKTFITDLQGLSG